MENGLFRKSPLERIASPERLNEAIKVINPGIWGVLLGCLALLLAAFFWGIYGSIPDTVQAEGVIFPQNGVTAVIPTAGGRISDMRVKVGDFVEAGQIIAVIPQEDLIRQLTELKGGARPDEKKIAALTGEYERDSLLISPVAGIVLSAKPVNATVSATEAVAGIVRQEKYADNRQVIAYIPNATAKKLKEGMEVQVSPDFAPREEYGYMYGNITAVGAYPVSEEEVLAAVGSPQYAEGLLPQGSCVEVRVTLTVDPDSPNKVKWSNPKGRELALSIGTGCRLLVVVKNYKPYELVFS
jgi:multidrug efflux pump subunit AcrA (membrane-fusion protein)